MNITQEQRLDFDMRFLSYINRHDFFWSKDIRRDLNIVYSKVSRNPFETLLLRYMKVLKDNYLLGISDSSHIRGKQYYKLVDRKLEIKDFK